jgi:prolyl-tRNA editing enzyme YbaK/EbsC (Cys-tRNA(Pro) deacylase)
VGSASLFATKREMPMCIEETILALPRIFINVGRRGYSINTESKVCLKLLDARRVNCVLDD